MWSQILPGLRIKLFMTLLLGVIYPLAITGICQALFPRQSNGSLLMSGGGVVGSELIGQNFTRPEYFQPRPSAAGSGYDPTASGGSNLGPTSAKFIHGTNLRLVHYTVDNDVPYESSASLEEFKDAKGNLDDAKLIKAFNDEKNPLTFRAKAPVPADAVTGSASGLDPHISPANAQLQAARVAKARGVSGSEIKQLVSGVMNGADLRILGEPRVNVLRLNLALDQRFPIRTARNKPGE